MNEEMHQARKGLRRRNGQHHGVAADPFPSLVFTCFSFVFFVLFQFFFPLSKLLEGSRGGIDRIRGVGGSRKMDGRKGGKKRRKEKKGNKGGINIPDPAGFSTHKDYKFSQTDYMFLLLLPPLTQTDRQTDRHRQKKCFSL